MDSWCFCALFLSCAMDSYEYRSFQVHCAGWPREASVAQEGDRSSNFCGRARAQNRHLARQYVITSHHWNHWIIELVPVLERKCMEQLQASFKKISQSRISSNKQQTRPIICCCQSSWWRCWWTHVESLSRYHQEDFAVYHWGTACLHCKRACKQSLSWDSWPGCLEVKIDLCTVLSNAPAEQIRHWNFYHCVKTGIYCNRERLTKLVPRFRGRAAEFCTKNLRKPTFHLQGAWRVTGLLGPKCWRLHLRSLWRMWP